MSCKRIKILAASGFSLIPGTFVWIAEKGAQSKRERNNCSKKMHFWGHSTNCAALVLHFGVMPRHQCLTFICFHPEPKLPENFPAWKSGYWRMQTGFPPIIQAPRVTAIWEQTLCLSHQLLFPFRNSSETSHGKYFESQVLFMYNFCLFLCISLQSTGNHIFADKNEVFQRSPHEGGTQFPEVVTCDLK